MILGYHDETLTLFGFGVDSFIELISGLGILIMILRIRKNIDNPNWNFEVTALRITGTAFYLLSLGLMIGIVFNIIFKHKPETSFWGVVISIISILVMVWLMRSKKRVGQKLNSQAILSDSNCTKICIYMSVVLLVASLIYELTGFLYADTLGTAGLIYFSIIEGREAFEKAKGNPSCCDDPME